MPQVSVNEVVGSPMLGASSRNSLFAQPKRVAVTSIASSEYVAARGLMLDGRGAPIRPVVPEPVTPPTPPTPPSGGAVPSVPPSAPSISSPSAPSYDSVRSAPTGAILDAAKDGINVRARAQYNSGQVDFRPGASGDVVELLAPSAIINWDTFLTGSGGNAVTFLGTGGKLDFTSALSGYTVLNRVFTGTIDSAIRIDGAVTSTINNGAATGGNVWFYSPGGVIIGSTGAFNVGGLVLTSSQLDAIGAGGTLMEFGGVALPSSAVIVERGANITTDSYFAVVAPRIEQHGNVRSAGSVAYVGAKQAKLTMSNGLFDISVDVGTADQNGIVHTGTTSGPAASGGDPRAISMVAVPQNTAMTMLVGGNVGYQAAGGVSVDADGRIILTAGVGGSVNVSNAKLTGNTAISAGDSVRFGADAGGVTTASGDVAISAGVASVKGGSIAITSAGTVNVAGNLDLNVSASGGRNVTLGRGQVDIAASGAGSTMSIGGDLTVNASTDGIITEAGADVVNLSVDGTGAAGGIRIGGQIAIDTSASAGSDFITTEAGGVAIDVTGGALSFAGLTLDAQSSATGSAMGQSGDGRDYRGGAFSLQVGDDGAVTGGAVTIDSSAAGVDGRGGKGSGGAVDLAITGGNLSLGAVSVTSIGIGGDAPDQTSVTGFTTDPVGGFGTQRIAAATGFPSAGDGGDGVGGNMVFTVDGGDATTERVEVIATGIGSDGANGSSEFGTNGGDAGDGIGGTATFNAFSGSLNILAEVIVSATGNSAGVQGVGGNGNGSDGGAGGRGIGGTATFNMDGTATITTGAITVDASSYGGAGGVSTIRPFFSSTGFDPANNGGDGGSAIGGTAVFNDTSGTLNVATIAVRADAFGGAGGGAQTGGGVSSEGGMGGSATAGSATINLNQNDASGRDYTAVARATGGNGGFGDIAGIGGDAIGGNASINVNNAQINVGSAALDTQALGGMGGISILDNGLGGNGGNAIGGTSSLIVDGNTASFSSSFRTDVSALATGGDGGIGGLGGLIGGTGGVGGSATGGAVVINASNIAVVDLVLFSDISAAARGGNGGSGGTGSMQSGGGGAAGDAQGGSIDITAETGGALNLSGINGILGLDAGAIGGAGGDIGDPMDVGLVAPGGNGAVTGGIITLTADGQDSYIGALGALSVSTVANGFSESRQESTGSSATGGTIAINVLNQAAIAVGGDLLLNSSATAAGGVNNRSDSQGGRISLTIDDNSFANLAVVGFNADGIAQSGISGIGTSGAAGGDGLGGIIDIKVGSNSGLSSIALNASAAGAGGTGGDGDTGFDGGSGGAGTGGTVSFSTGTDVQILDSFVLTANGDGGSGGASRGLGDGGTGGTGQGGSASFEANGTGALLPLFGGVQLGAVGSGGAGGNGGAGDASSVGGLGGIGGDGLGGTNSFAISGTGATFTYSESLVGMDTLGLGGSGGAGGDNLFGGTGGQGGTGGDASGGKKIIQANSGTIITLQPFSAGPFQMSAAAFGGNGGSGGNLDLTNGGIQGAGGDGGAGTGGSPTLRSIGGTITSGDVQIDATGYGGNGGLGGDDGNATLGPSGNGGNGIGGTPTLETFNGSPGIITFGDVTIDATGIGGGGTIIGSTAGGQITITDSSADPAGLISMSSLTATAIGANGVASLTIGSDSGPIMVTNNVDANISGNINFEFVGDGQLDVGGTTTLNATLAITGTHGGNGSALNSIHSGTDFVATAGTDIDFGPGFVTAAGRDASLSAQSVTFGAVNSLRDVIINAATGSITGTGNISAGRDVNLDAVVSIDVQNITGTRDITVDAGTDVTAGDITLTGPDFISLQRVLINAGGDVALGNVDAIDALVVTGQNVNALSLDGQTVDVTAGGLIDVGTATSETTIDFLATDIKLANADAVQNITLDAMGGAISLGTINSENQLIATASGDIDFTNLTGLVVTLDAGGAITGGSAAADRNIISPMRNVNLTAVGAIDIDSASAVNSVIASGANFIATSVDAGNIISVNVPGAIDIGTSDSGNETVLTGGTVLLGSGVAVGGISAITATAGPVNIGAFDTNNFLDITSDTTVDFGTLTARAMTIIANGNVTGTRAATDVNLISGRPRNVNINTTGAVNVGQIDTVNSIVISAASVDSDLFDAGGDISVSVSGLADIVQVNSTGSTTVTGSSILIGNGVSTGLALLTSTGGNVTIGNWDSQGFFDIDSAQDAIFDTVTGRVVDIVAVGDISGTSAATDVALISGRPRNVNLDAGGLVTIGNTASIGNTIVNGGAVKAGTLGANGTVTVTASGAAEVDNLQSGMAASVTGADVTLVDGDVGGVLTANALAGDLAITGTMSVGGNINLDAFRNINFGVLGTTGGSLDANAGRDIIFNSASANIDVDLIANGVVGGNVVNGRIVTVNSGSIDIGSLTATFSSDIDSTQADIVIGTLNSSGNTSLNAARNLIVNDGATGVFTGIAVNDITLGNLTTTGAVADIRLTAGGTAGYSLIDGDRLVVIDAGSIQGGTIIADAQTTLTGGTINIGDVTADTGFIVLESTVGNLRAGNLTALVNGVQIASAADLAIGTTSGTSLTTNSVGGTVMGDAAFTGTISIIADGTLDAGHLDSNAVSPGLGVTTGGDARIASATADGLLTLEIGGSLTGGDFSGSGVTTVNADSVNIASVESRAGTLQVDATGEIVIDQIGSAFATNLTGGSVTVNNGAVGGIFNVSATAGDIAGTGSITAGGAISLNATGNIGFGTLDATNGNFRATAGGDINFTGASSNAIVDFAAGGAINGGDLDAGITLTLDAGRIAIGNATGRSINLSSASDILFDSLTTPNALSVTAANGMIGANTGSGDIDAGSTVTLLSREIAVGDVSSGGAVNAQATAGDAAFGTVDAATSIAIVATGTPTLANAISGGNTSVTGASVMFDNGAIGGSLALSATAGNIASNGAVIVAGGITLDAIGDVSFGSLKAQNGDFTISAGGNVLATHAEASGDFRSSSAGTFTTGLNSIITGGDIIIASGNAVNLGNSTAGGLINVTGSQIDFVNLIAGQTIDLLTIITPNTSGGNGNIAGTNMTAGSGASSATSAGSIAINGVSDIGGSLTLDAANDITIGQSDVRGGDLLATAGGTITSGAATVSGALDFLAANSILITGNVLAGGLVSIEAVNGSISGQDISAGAGADIGAQTTILLGDVTLAAGGASVSANGNIVLGSISGADSAGIAITSGAGSVSFTDLAADGGISILAEIGALTGNDIASGGAVSVDGDSVALHNVTSGDDLFGIAESGTFTLNSADSAGEIFISVATQSDIGSLAAATDITVSGGNIGLGQATAGGDIELTSGGAFGIVTGSLTSGGRLVIGAGLDGFTGTTLDAGSVINIDSNGDVSLGDAAAGANLLIDTINGSVIADSLFSAANIFVDAGGDVAVGSAATANSGQGLVDIISDGAITIADVAGNSAYLEARGGDLVVDQSINVVGLVEAYGESILLRTPGNLAVTAEASDGTINIVVGGDLDIQGASAPGNIDLTSTGGSAQVNAAVVNLGAAPTPGVQGTQQITTSGGNVTITAASDVTVNSFIDAANALTIAAGGLLDLRATASGADIDVVAADINIDANGALGRSDRTDTILIASGSDIYLGGAGGLSNGFELDKDEFTRVFSGGDITIEAFAVTTGGSGNLTVDDLDVLAVTATASPTATDGNIAANGTLALSAGGSVDVIGGLTVINAGADTNLAIFAANQINVDVDSGNLRMEEDTNVLGGNIELSAPSIFAISAAAAADIAGAALDDIDQRLGQNDGSVRDEGYFQATNLTFNIDNDLLIQNSGAGTDFADRRGFTADSVTINEIDAVDPLRIVINGVVDGNTGLDAVSLVNITTAFDLLSTINGCLIASPSSCVIVPETPETSIDNPLQDLIDEEIEKDSPTEVSVSTMIIQFRDDPEREPDPLINEPVTGAGNEDLWVSEDDCDTSAETCEVAAEEELEPAE